MSLKPCVHKLFFKCQDADTSVAPGSGSSGTDQFFILNCIQPPIQAEWCHYSRSLQYCLCTAFGCSRRILNSNARWSQSTLGRGGEGEHRDGSRVSLPASMHIGRHANEPNKKSWLFRHGTRARVARDAAAFFCVTGRNLRTVTHCNAIESSCIMASYEPKKNGGSYVEGLLALVRIHVQVLMTDHSASRVSCVLGAGAVLPGAYCQPLLCRLVKRPRSRGLLD